jgi:twitching motility protein PilT
MTNSSFPSLADLNRNPVITDTLADLSRPGLVLVSGTTGTGKSTTLAAMGSDLQNNGYKVFSLRTYDDEVLPGLDEIVKHAFDRSMIRSVLGVYQPDVVLIDNLSSAESYKFAVDLAAKDALVIASLPAISPEDAVRRMVNSYYYANGGDGEATVNAVMVMSIHQKTVPATENEFGADHWAAVDKAQNLMRIANPNPIHPPFNYRDDRKVETNIRIYAPAL